jgi:3-deoxy-7-phosphoheptulonate synthase
MQNYPLLREVGRTEMPILLKRGLASTIEEWLSAAEYIMLEGNGNVILCERGIRTFSEKTRFTLDISAVPVIKELSHLPIIVDPSHAAGNSSYVKPLSLAARAVGADGIMVEVHHNPAEALSDGRQSLTFHQFEDLMGELRKWI